MSPLAASNPKENKTATSKVGARKARLPRNGTEFLWDVAEGWSFGLRIPLCFERKNQQRQFASSLWIAPLIGLCLCLLSSILGWVFWWWTGSFLLASLVVLSGMLYFSGSLHEDGLADVADALGVIGDDEQAQQKRLEVMKDPRLGTFGVQALLLSFGFRFLGMITICSSIGFEGMVIGLLGLVPSTRMLMVWLLRLLPSVRKGGIADRAGMPSYGVVLVATFLGVVPMVAVFGLWSGLGLLVLLCCFGVWFLMIKKKFSGATGDSCGALVIVGEVGLWLWFAGLVHWLPLLEARGALEGFNSWRYIYFF